MYYTYTFKFKKINDRIQFEVVMKDLVDSYHNMTQALNDIFTVKEPELFVDYNTRSDILIALLLSEDAEATVPYNTGAAIDEIYCTEEGNLEITLFGGKNPLEYLNKVLETSAYLDKIIAKGVRTRAEWEEYKQTRSNK